MLSTTVCLPHTSVSYLWLMFKLQFNKCIVVSLLMEHCSVISTIARSIFILSDPSAPFLACMNMPDTCRLCRFKSPIPPSQFLFMSRRTLSASSCKQMPDASWQKSSCPTYRGIWHRWVHFAENGCFCAMICLWSVCVEWSTSWLSWCSIGMHF